MSLAYQNGYLAFANPPTVNGGRLSSLLCFYDWSAEVPIGNVLEQELSEIIGSANFQAVLKELKGGSNPPAVCKRCLYPTHAVTFEYQAATQGGAPFVRGD